VPETTTVHPDTRYARSDDVSITYQVFGSSCDLVDWALVPVHPPRRLAHRGGVRLTQAGVVSFGGGSCAVN
jgi:hypothetical protein